MVVITGMHDWSVNRFVSTPPPVTRQTGAEVQITDAVQWSVLSETTFPLLLNTQINPFGPALASASTALVKTPMQFYVVRFLLGLAEAGFFPGIVVYLTHWFPSRERARALSLFLVATPVAQMLGPKITGALATSGATSVLGVTLQGWQWVFVAWGLPATILGVVVFFFLTDRPRLATWLTPAERDALEGELAREKAAAVAKHRMKFSEALRNPKVLLLVTAYFFVVAGNYGLEFFLPSILKAWYSLKTSDITTFMIFPPIIAIGGQLFVGWNSDRTGERRWHAATAMILGEKLTNRAPTSRKTVGQVFSTMCRQ